jgi:fucose permease
LILAAAPLAIEELRQLTPQALHAYRVQEAASVKLPYSVIGIALIVLAVLIGSFRLPKIENASYQRGPTQMIPSGNIPIWFWEPFESSPTWARKFPSEASS